MRKIEDLTGQQFGYLIIIEFAGIHKRNAQWKCRCECGNEKVVMGHNLKSGNVKSCGCLRSETTSARCYKHGGTNTRLYNIFSQMLNRCNNQNNTNYKDYGGRGITVCNEWLVYQNFKAWALANGYADDLTIDRIDNDKGYSPENCRWATRKEQNGNRRNNRLITFEGETKTLSQWATDKNISRDVLRSRLDMDWTVEDVLTKPVKKWRHKI